MGTNIDDIVFVGYVNNRNFSLVYNETMRPPEEAGDIGPEQMRWIDGEHYGEPLLVVSHPQSASITMYRIDCGESPFITTTKMVTTKEDDDGMKEDETLTILEIAAIAVGSLAIIAMGMLIIYLISKRRNANSNIYRYSSGNGDFGSPQGHYTELEM